MKILYNFYYLQMRSIFYSMFIVLAAYSSVYSQNPIEESRPFQNTIILGLDAGVTFPQTDYENSKIGYAFQGLAEYYFKTNSIHYVGFKLNLGYDQVTGEDSRGTISTQNGPINIPPKFSTGNLTVGLAVSYGICISNVVIPFVSGGISENWFDPTNANGQPAPGNSANLYEKNTIAYTIGGGIKYLVNDKLSINLSANQYIPQSDYLDDVAAAYSDDAFTTVFIGVSFAPFYKTDSDNDGITGSADLCPNDPEDYDGFEDEDGCPDLDNDGDNILDNADKCPNEAEDLDGFEDSDGCPELDNDGDGLLDIYDKCPNEAEDIDGDTDEDGCPEENQIVVQDKYILLCDDIFSSNSAMLKIEGKEKLDQIILKLQKQPDKKWRIESYMDSNGNKKLLRNLSLDRAKAVLEYFTYFGGLKRENFQVFGLGDKFPIGDNNTEEGRKENRRIEIIAED